jgi:(p)ppGpp synthase/HD superfamily hydrolase
MVAEVTDDKSIMDKAERKRMQVVNASHKSPGAALVKLADKTSNVRDVGTRPAAGWSEERRLEYLNWAQQVVDALPLSDHPLKDAFEASLARSVALVKTRVAQAAPNGGSV